MPERLDMFRKHDRENEADFPVPFRIPAIIGAAIVRLIPSSIRMPIVARIWIQISEVGRANDDDAQQALGPQPAPIDFYARLFGAILSEFSRSLTADNAGREHGLEIVCGGLDGMESSIGNLSRRFDGIDGRLSKLDSTQELQSRDISTLLSKFAIDHAQLSIRLEEASIGNRGELSRRVEEASRITRAEIGRRVEEASKTIRGDFSRKVEEASRTARQELSQRVEEASKTIRGEVSQRVEEASKAIRGEVSQLSLRIDEVSVRNGDELSRAIDANSKSMKSELSGLEKVVLGCESREGQNRSEVTRELAALKDSISNLNLNSNSNPVGSTLGSNTRIERISPDYRIRDNRRLDGLLSWLSRTNGGQNVEDLGLVRVITDGPCSGGAFGKSILDVRTNT
jgi:hypothetical protein